MKYLVFTKIGQTVPEEIDVITKQDMVKVIAHIYDNTLPSIRQKPLLGGILAAFRVGLGITQHEIDSMRGKKNGAT